MSVKVLQGDMLALIPTLGPASMDAVVTDPPYHLTSIVDRFGKSNSAPAKYGKDGAFSRVSKGFMSQTWDGGDIAFNVETWRLVYDALKPGAHLVAFGGTRTFHRMACAIEDAGFEIRDTLMWLYGSGFPKSLDVSKQIDKAAGAEREITREGVKQIGGYGDDWDTNSSSERERRDIPATPEAARWQGWGTALKPAWEPILLCRKPLSEGTVAANVLAHGTGAINIDACRIEANDAPEGRTRHGGGRAFAEGVCGFKQDAITTAPAGRWPANVLHDGSEEVEAAFAAFNAPRQQGRARTDGVAQGNNTYGALRHITTAPEPRGDTGTASRFFYCAKASKADRAGSKHPTVKPQALMRWLCRLVTPPGGIILDCFAGSGSTGAAAMREGFNAVLIEREAEYVADIQRRIEQVEAEATTIITTAQMDMFA